MALIKCSECGKEISDKAEECPHCGCPKKEQDKFCIECGKKIKKEENICPNCGCPQEDSEKVPEERLEKKTKTKGKKTTFMTVWLIICAVVCFQIAPVALLVGLSEEVGLAFCVLGYLAGILGINYLMLNKHVTLLNYILFLGTNFLIFAIALLCPIYRGVFFYGFNLLKLGPVLCVILNTALTSAFICKGLHKEKTKFMDYLGLVIAGGIGLIVLILYLLVGNINSVYGTYVQAGGANAVIEIKRNGKCDVYLDDDEDYSIETDDCEWELDGSTLTIEFEMTLRNYTSSYSDTAILEGTLYDNKYVTDGGAVYYKE